MALILVDGRISEHKLSFSHQHHGIKACCTAIVGLRESVVCHVLLGATCMKKRQFMNLCIEIKVFDMFSKIKIT